MQKARTKRKGQGKYAPRFERDDGMFNGFFAGFFGFRPEPEPPFNPNPPQLRLSKLERELLKEGYRALAIKYHPDKGGDPEKMKELNALKVRLGI